MHAHEEAIDAGLAAMVKATPDAAVLDLKYVRKMMRAFLPAFLRKVEPSEGMTDAGRDEMGFVDNDCRRSFAAMARQLAAEIDPGKGG